jgi:hypothetical protein
MTAVNIRPWFDNGLVVSRENIIRLLMKKRLVYSALVRADARDGHVILH